MSTDYWWAHILTLPESTNDISYQRLERISTDKTRYKGRGDNRLHEICNVKHETNLTLNVFETFSLFPDGLWLSNLFTALGIVDVGEIQELNWSYEWEYREGRRIKLIDVVINFKTKHENSIVIVEAKNKGKLLGEKDADLDYYLKIPTFEKYDQRYLFFLVDQDLEKDVEKQIVTAKNVKVYTWQKMCDLQLNLVDTLALNSKLKMFIKSSIHKMYQNFGLASLTIPNTYIAAEPPMSEKVEVTCGKEEMEREIWRIDN